MGSFIWFFLFMFVRETVNKKCSRPNVSKEPYVSVFVNDIEGSEYTCPGVDDPVTHTECCWDGVCCPHPPPHHLTAQGDSLLMLLSICVIVACSVVVVSLLIGCFWVRGYCYQCCPTIHTVPEIPMYSLAEGEETQAMMPTESGCHRYLPSNCRTKFHPVTVTSIEPL